MRDGGYWGNLTGKNWHNCLAELDVATCWQVQKLQQTQFAGDHFLDSAPCPHLTCHSRNCSRSRSCRTHHRNSMNRPRGHSHNIVERLNLTKLADHSRT